MLTLWQRRVVVLTQQLRAMSSTASGSVGSSSPAAGTPIQQLMQEAVEQSGSQDVNAGWSKAWEKQVTPWDAGDSSPILLRAIDQGWLSDYRNGFVPGCGSGYDVLHLSRVLPEGAVGLDVAELAVEKFKRLREEKGVPEDKAMVVLDDFFAYEPPKPFDFIFDYTFLCAMQPSQRDAWADTIKRLLRPGGELMTIIYPINPSLQSGPPFAMTYDLVAGLLEPRGFEKFYEEEHPVDSIKPRRGMEHLVRWRLRGAAEEKR